MTFCFGRKPALPVVVAMAVVQGCASGQPPEPFGKSGANTGYVYVSRPSQFVGIAASMNVNVNGKAIGSINNGQCIRLMLPPGRHTISGGDLLPADDLLAEVRAKRDAVYVDVRAGSSTYVLITPTMVTPGMYTIFPARVAATGRRC